MLWILKYIDNMQMRSEDNGKRNDEEARTRRVNLGPQEMHLI